MGTRVDASSQCLSVREHRLEGTDEISSGILEADVTAAQLVYHWTLGTNLEGSD